ncbi:MAG: 4Fe-4S binding protein [Thermoplasmata archaeon]|nr:4Fe-4S binding protein [Thermoplasmata archaeon]
MVVREIIKIDEDKCTGCGLCIPNCPEGALQIIDDKARMISDLFCDGLGACIGYCPEGAITIEKREAEPYDERKVMENVVKQGANTIKAHLKHMQDHKEFEFLDIAIDYLKENDFDVPDIGYEPKPKEEPSACGCPGELARTIETESVCGCCDDGDEQAGQEARLKSTLSTWPIQLKLVNTQAPYLKNARLLMAADCAGFAYPNLHQDFIKDRVTIIACPKLDDANYYVDKMAELFKLNDIQDITILMMEVPCCFGLERVVSIAMEKAGKSIPFEKIIIKVDGTIK